MKDLCILYIPGLGDVPGNGQKLAITLWRVLGVKSEYFVMAWSTNEPWVEKQARLLARIDALLAIHKTVALVGSSAGAAAALDAYAQRADKLTGVAVIAAKALHSQTVGSNHKTRNPALRDAVQASETSLRTLTSEDKKRIVSLYARYDEIVPGKDSIIAGAHNIQTKTAGHVFTIALQLTLGAPRIVRMLRKMTQH